MSLTEDKQLSFENQNIFVGIDVHLRQWTVTIRSKNLFLKTFSMDPSPVLLHNHLKKHYPGANYHSVYEAGFCGFWIHRELTALGINNIVINPADVPTTHKEKARKRDKVDSKKLSKTLSTGSLEAIYVPDPFHEQLRSLCRLYRKEVNHRTRLKNRIRSFLHFNGIPIPPRGELYPWTRRFIEWLESIEFTEESSQDYQDFCIEELKQTKQRILAITRKLRNFSKSEPINSIVNISLRSIPGVGFKTAMTFYCEIIDIHRFENFDKLSSYVGLIPDCDSTGDNENETGLTFRRNKYLRYMLVESAWTAITKDPALTLKYEELVKRMKAQYAIIRITKKLLSRMSYVWRNQTKYTKSIVK